MNFIQYKAKEIIEDDDKYPQFTEDSVPKLSGSWIRGRFKAKYPSIDIDYQNRQLDAIEDQLVKHLQAGLENSPKSLREVAMRIATKAKLFKLTVA